jgi:SAM-dependent methyltransferase
MTDRRQILLRGLDLARLRGLEVGPLMSPFVAKSDGDVVYVDHADTATLRQKYAADPNVEVDRIVEVDAVWGECSLLECLDGRKVDYVIASHVAEHVPDLVTWLQEIEAVLASGGELRLALPDKRFTFDCLREEARFTDLIHAYIMRARQPLPHALLDCVLDVAANADAERICRGSQLRADIERCFSFEHALEFVRDARESGKYIDVHCWVVTPRRFAELMERLVAVGLVRFACTDFVDTILGSFDFYVAMQPSSDKDHAMASWRRMAKVSRDDPHGGITNPRSAQLTEPALTSDEAIWLRNRIAAMEASTSWRVTAPLRAAARLLRKIGGREGIRANDVPPA